MKRLLLIGAVAAVMVGCVAAAFALPSTSSHDNWVIELQASTSADSCAGNQLIIGTSTSCTSDTANNGKDLEVYWPRKSDYAEITAYDKPITVSVDTTYSQYMVELYTPLARTSLEITKVWNMNLFVADNYESYNSDGLVELLAWQPSRYGLAASGLDPTNFTTVALYLTTNTGTSFDPAQSTILWDLKALGGKNSTSTSGEFKTTMPQTYYGSTIAGSGGLGSTAYHLQLVATSVAPEPGSLLALLSGLVGLVVSGIRRRP